MQLRVLVDNNTLIDRYFTAEPGLSFFIEDGGKRILFDAGYSGIFIENARKMGIDLLRTDDVVISHGHLDHTWGLEAFIRLHTEAAFEQMPRTRPTFIAHPDAFLTRSIGEIGEIGCHLSVEELFRHGTVLLTASPLWLTDDLVFLGRIEQRFDFEAAPPIGEVYTQDGVREDRVVDDSALACRTEEGLVVITGCAHAGICSTIEQAKEVCGEDRVVDVVGGFHLLDPAPERLAGTLEYFRDLAPAAVHACHCTDLASKIALARVVNVREVGVGLHLAW
jgi:7,8-dihydropterin-6-yl-methyl-4-(beta-D-ribofuranosyl)aminobenzene 5'-phosphate synthase